ncbi:MAG: nucleotide sugar dehydrogenase [Alphaproteobacteria bacterium]|jgi:GDP-mannose 6-dehydrogenase|nr:nucleotide sugar dehydrogenase [Thalassospira sp.]MCE2964671.1 nucleotide sugar dehydrogenase [Alphaproteobacteria bacterium]
MRISIFGLGYVGSVAAACLAEDGHTVVGVDLEAAKIEAINAGRSPIIEKDLDTLIEKNVKAGRLSATNDARSAVMNSDISFICVATPSQANGNLGTAFLHRIAEQIGGYIREKKEKHIVVLRSTVLPGTLRGLIIPILEEHSGKKAGVDFGVCNNPEFLRESTAVYDYYNPPKTVLGSVDEASAKTVASLYEKLPGELIITSVETAELVKYADNAWHAVKVTFANEIGAFAKACGVDSHRVMDIFCKDTKLNLSPYYLKPGYAFGGSCLPKDVRALNYAAKSRDVEVPLLASLLPSNTIHTQRGVDMVLQTGKTKVGILGFSFKAGTDDLRESPLVTLIEALLGKGIDLKLFDKNVKLASLVGANKNYIVNRIPHISRLMLESVDAVLAHADVIVIGNGDAAFRDVPKRARPDQTVIDLVRVGDAASSGNYQGICW